MAGSGERSMGNPTPPVGGLREPGRGARGEVGPDDLGPGRGQFGRRRATLRWRPDLLRYLARRGEGFAARRIGRCRTLGGSVVRSLVRTVRSPMGIDVRIAAPDLARFVGRLRRFLVLRLAAAEPAEQAGHWPW